MGPTKTELYNVYIVYYETPPFGGHEGIALVPAQEKSQNGGRFYHVKGNPFTGMEYDSRNVDDFSIAKTFKTKVYQFQLPVSYLSDFERIAKSHSTQYGPHALTDSDEDLPFGDCVDWVAGVLKGVRAFLKSAGMAA